MICPDGRIPHARRATQQNRSAVKARLRLFSRACGSPRSAREERSHHSCAAGERDSPLAAAPIVAPHLVLLLTSFRSQRTNRNCANRRGRGLNDSFAPIGKRCLNERLVRRSSQGLAENSPLATFPTSFRRDRRTGLGSTLRCGKMIDALPGLPGSISTRTPFARTCHRCWLEGRSINAGRFCGPCQSAAVG
jgi:hypothetical protein